MKSIFAGLPVRKRVHDDEEDATSQPRYLLLCLVTWWGAAGSLFPRKRKDEKVTFLVRVNRDKRVITQGKVYVSQKVARELQVSSFSSGWMFGVSSEAEVEPGIGLSSLCTHSKFSSSSVDTLVPTKQGLASWFFVHTRQVFAKWNKTSFLVLCKYCQLYIAQRL